MPKITDAKILVIATHGFEQSELEFPRDQLRVQGAEVHVASLDGKAIKGWEGTDWGREVGAGLKIEDADPTRYDAIVIPGGQINPDILRMNERAVAIVREFGMSNKPIAAICHAPWLLAEADLVKGKTVTSWPSIRTDLANAGANVVDQEVAQDGNLITSRNPDDIPAFSDALIARVKGRVPENA
ncbi:MAG: type 1 glutamine amidotransferase domain-containing protein [Martelella sp.]